MLSAIHAGFSAMPFPASEGGFTPWECQFPQFLLQSESVVMPFGLQEPVLSSSSSDLSNPNPVCSGSGSDEPNRGSGLSRNGNCTVIDERKRKRMESNRESARRSRMRKQKHLENLRFQVNRLRLGNRELMNRVHLVSLQHKAVQSENDRLQSESAFLRQKLWDLHQVLLVRELQQLTTPS